MKSSVGMTVQTPRAANDRRRLRYGWVPAPDNALATSVSSR